MFDEYRSSDDGIESEAFVFSGSFEMTIADEVIHKQTTAAKQARTHQKRCSVINKRIRRLKKRHMLYEGRGKPRALDHESLDIVRDKFQPSNRYLPYGLDEMKAHVNVKDTLMELRKLETSLGENVASHGQKVHNMSETPLFGCHPASFCN